VTNRETQQLAGIIAEHYDIGTLVGCEKLLGGTVNTSFKIETSKEGSVERYFLRIYKQGISADEIEFEHALLNHLVTNGFDLVAPALPTRHGISWVEHSEESESESAGDFYAIFKFLSGEDKYPWDNPACNTNELKSSAQVLARYHQKVSGFMRENQRREPRILDFLPRIADKIKGFIALDRQSTFDRLLRQNSRLISGNIDDTIRALEPVKTSPIPELAIHSDYHPGNLKFQQDQVIGIFDFDWSKIDYRLFDVALALHYFCTIWRGPQDGQLHIGKLTAFLNTYQQAAALNSQLGPLDSDELAFLLPMIMAANIYVLNWTLTDFYTKTCDLDTYRAYLEHSIRQIQWVQTPRNRQDLERVTQAG